jgi:hypothetical protein
VCHGAIPSGLVCEFRARTRRGRGGIAGKAQARVGQARAEDNGKDVHDRTKQKETVANRIQNPMAFESLTYLSIFILYPRWAVLEREPGSADLL